MQHKQPKLQSEPFFPNSNDKCYIFSAGLNLSSSFNFIQPNQNQKFKIPKVNTQEAKSIFLELNKKNSVEQAPPKKNWKFQETSLLIYLVEKFSSLENVQNVTDLSPHIWSQIQEFIPGRSAQDCKYKVLSMTAPTITSMPWSVEQKNLLTEIIVEEGMNWNVVSQRLYEKSDKKVFRTSKQCKEHYMCFLKPNLKKGVWTEEQDYKLVCFFLQYGRKWSKIMKFIEGRNQNSIKNSKEKTSNQSDLLRKVKRKKQKMEKNFEDTVPNLGLPIQEKSLEQITIDKAWQKVQEMQQQKSVVWPKTKKSEALEFNDYLIKQKQNMQQSRKEFQECLQSSNRLSLSDFQSFQHLDYLHLDLGQKQSPSIEAFESFERYICL